MPYKIKITLPVSKKEVIIQSPQWGVQEEVTRYSKANGLDANGSTMFLMSKIVTIEGNKVAPDEFKEWEYNDYVFAVDCFEKWKGQPVDETPGPLPANPAKNG